MHASPRALVPVAAAAAVMLAGAPAQAAPIVPFYADSGDSCRRGVTEGTLDWRYDGPVVRPLVTVAGFVSDSADNAPCLPDTLYTTATFTAYGGFGVIDTEVRKVDNAREKIAFDLTDATGVRRIDIVVIQVCRQSSATGPVYCGDSKQYRAP